MARRRRNIDEEGMELNMTPMLDVVFILLIFFIVTSVFVKTPGIDPLIPTSADSSSWKPGILIAVNSEDEIWIDKTPYTLEEAEPIIRGMRDENPKADAIIQGDGDASVGTVMELQDMMVDLGIRVWIKTEE